MLKTALASLTVFSLSFGVLAASPPSNDCAHLAGHYSLNSRAKNDLTTTLDITQDECKTIHMTWYSAGEKGAEYFAIIDGKPHPASQSEGLVTTETWIWHKNVLEQIQESKNNSGTDEVLDALYYLDDQKNLDLTVGIIENGTPVDSADSLYVRIP